VAFQYRFSLKKRVLIIGGLLKRKERFKGKKVVAVVCGRNIDLEVFKKIIA
jgi:threonine dehydratase